MFKPDFSINSRLERNICVKISRWPFGELNKLIVSCANIVHIYLVLKIYLIGLVCFSATTFLFYTTTVFLKTTLLEAF